MMLRQWLYGLVLTSLLMPFTAAAEDGISGETDMLVQVEAASMARLAEIRGVIEGFPGMQRVKTHMVVNEWAM